MTHRSRQLRGRRAGPGRGRGRAATSSSRTARSRERRAADLRAAAVLRGVPARPPAHRAHRHHLADLRDLPGRLPDQRLPGHRGRLRGRASTAPIAALRRLLYCGEWISSHALHIYLLHAPDFLGYPDVDRARPRPPRRRRARPGLKKAGNAILELGRRPRHPPGQPARRRLLPGADRGRAAPLAEQLRRALDDALATVGWVAGVRLPGPRARPRPARRARPGPATPSSGDEHRDRQRAALPGRRVRRPRHRDQVPHSTALHATLDGGTLPDRPAGPVHAQLGAAVAARAARPPTAAGLGATCRNPFRSIVGPRRRDRLRGRGGAADHRRATSGRTRPSCRVPPRAGTGHGVSEAPRGLLYHRYELDADGTDRARPPSCRRRRRTRPRSRTTCAASWPANLDLDDAALTALCERTIRNYDPCISCSAHFLDLTVERR